MKRIIHFFMMLLLVSIGWEAEAQSCYTTQGYSNYANFGFNSTIASTLEYDNYVSSYHSTMVRDIDGSFKIWGQATKPDGAMNDGYLVPTTVNAGNFPGLTGTPLKMTVGGLTQEYQHILLTSDNKIWVWGMDGGWNSSNPLDGLRGGVIHRSIISNRYQQQTNFSRIPFQQINLYPGGGTSNLPVGVTAANVKMMTASRHILAITTSIGGGTNGEVYVLAHHEQMRGGGATGATNNTWIKVQKSTGGDLTDIVATRVSATAVIALDNAGNLWTWGRRIYSGSGATTFSSTAVLMAPPSTTLGPIKMIGVTGEITSPSGGVYNATSTTYYVLYQNENLFALGDNEMRELGTWGTSASTAWVQPRYNSASGQVMNNIKWISPQENDGRYQFINVITNAKELYNWGAESGNHLGRGFDNRVGDATATNPGMPANFQSGYTNSGIIAVESGGHTTMILKECEDDFGYVGHRTLGSMGDGVVGDMGSASTDGQFKFTTSAVQICGALTTTASLESSSEGPFCVGGSVTLIGSPSGGTYAIDGTAGNTATATLSGTTLTFNSAGVLRVNYTVTAPCSSGSGSSNGTTTTVTVNKTFVVENCGTIRTISGSLWNDTNGNAIKETSETSLSNNMWANLVGPNNLILSSVQVTSGGGYTLSVGSGSVATAGSYAVVLTNTSKNIGDALTTADVPANSYQYTGTNFNGTASTSNTTGKLTVSTTAINSNISNANFGLRLPCTPPTASTNPTRTTCVNTALTSNITHTTTGATGINTASTGLPAGVTASWASNAITISGTPTVAGTFNYSIPLTGGCSSANAIGTIIVTAANTAATVANTTLCVNTSISRTQGTTGATGIGTGSGLPAGVAVSWASNTITFSGSPTAAGTFNYTIPLTGGCGTANATGTIIVSAANTAATVANTTLCVNTSISRTQGTTGATGIGTASGLPAGVAVSWASNTITFSGSPTATGTFNYSIPLTGGCGNVNATGTIVVNGIATTPSVYSSLQNNCFSHQTSVDLNFTYNGPGAPSGTSLVWYTTPTHDAGTQVLTPTSVGTGTYYAFYYHSVSNCFSPASNPVAITITNCCFPYSISGKVFEDANTNGIFDSGEIGIPHTVNIYSDHNGNGILDDDDRANSLLDTRSTNATGAYYSETDPGTYFVELQRPLPSGMVQTLPASQTYHTVTLDGVSLNCNVNFGLVEALGFCTQLGMDGTPDSYTQTGISDHQRQGNWPHNIPNGFIALASRHSGLVITRVQNQSQIAQPIEGMLIYDMAANCVKLYNGSTWKCLAKYCN